MSGRRIRIASALILSLAAGIGALAQGPAPGAPANLTYQVSGGSVWLNWISSTGMTPTFSPTSSFYRLEAGDSPGTTFFTWDSSSRGDTPASRKMFYMLTDFATAGVAPGNYYVRVRGVNNGVVGPPSNEVLVPVTGGCRVPAAPANFTAMTVGSTVYMGWNDGSGGLPTSYVVHARSTSGGPVIAALATSKPPAADTEPPQGGYLNVGGVPNGTYFVQVYAANACGTSPYSNEIVITAPNNGPAVRTPNAASGKLPWFQVRDLVQAATAAAGSRINYASSCPARPGFDPNDVEARKTQRNAYIDFVVAYLRQFDLRFGYNAKPTRENAQVAGDEIAYHWGSDAPEGSPNVYLFDTLFGHCTDSRESREFRPFFIEYGRWTLAGAF